MPEVDSGNQLCNSGSNLYDGNSKLMGNYGWVQNTSNLSTVRDTVELISDSGCTHNELMKNIYNSRIQNGEDFKKWSWDARCRIKAVIATGMATINRSKQGYDLTELGRVLIRSEKSDIYKGRKRILSSSEVEIFRQGVLTNPPVIRVLTLLNESRKTSQKPLSKYDIGGLLGFAGDIGFTHYEAEYVARLGKKFNNVEGDADKWARTIISWLTQLNWVIKSDSISIFNQTLSRYTTVYGVDKVLSYNAKSTVKYVPEEMLCSNRHPFFEIIKNRRKAILKSLSNTSIISASDLLNELVQQDIDTDEDTIKFDVLNLQRAGFNIKKERTLYAMKDKLIISEEADKSNINFGRVEGLEKEIEKMVTRYSDTLPPKLVDNLIRYCNDSKSASAPLFEVSLDKFFTLMGYETEYLGQGRGRVADIIVKYKDSNYPKSYAIIVDAKAYQKYNFPADDVRKMKEYIKLHGPELLMKDKIPRHSFAFVSLDFSNPDKKLSEISTYTHVSGTAIKIPTLLQLGSEIVQSKRNIEEIFEMFTTNKIFKIESIVIN